MSVDIEERKDSTRAGYGIDVATAGLDLITGDRYKDPEDLQNRRLIKDFNDANQPNNRYVYRPDTLPDTIIPERTPTGGLRYPVDPENFKYYKERPKSPFLSAMQATAAKTGDFAATGMSPLEMKPLVLTDEGKALREQSQVERRTAATSASVGPKLNETIEPSESTPIDLAEATEAGIMGRMNDLEADYQFIRDLGEANTAALASREQFFREANNIPEGRTLSAEEISSLESGMVMYDAQTKQRRFINSEDVGKYANFLRASWGNTAASLTREFILANPAYQGIFRDFMLQGSQTLASSNPDMYGLSPETEKVIDSVKPQAAMRFGIQSTFKGELDAAATNNAPSDFIMGLAPPEGWSAKRQYDDLREVDKTTFGTLSEILGSGNILEGAAMLKVITEDAVNPHHWFYLANNAVNTQLNSKLVDAYYAESSWYKDVGSWLAAFGRDSFIASPDAGFDILYMAASAGFAAKVNVAYKALQLTSKAVARKGIRRSFRNMATDGKTSLQRAIGRGADYVGSRAFRNRLLNARTGALDAFDAAGYALPFRWDELLREKFGAKYIAPRFRSGSIADTLLNNKLGRFVGGRYAPSFLEEGAAGALNQSDLNEVVDEGSQMSLTKAFLVEGAIGGVIGTAINYKMQFINSKVVNPIIGGIGAKVDAMGQKDGAAADLSNALGKVFKAVQLNSVGGRKKYEALERFRLATEAVFDGVEMTVEVEVLNPETGKMETVRVDNVDLDDNPALAIVLAIAEQDRSPEGLNKLETFTVENEDGSLEVKKMPKWLRLMHRAVEDIKARKVEAKDSSPVTLKELTGEILNRVVEALPESSRIDVMTNQAYRAGMTANVLRSHAIRVARDEGITVAEAEKKFSDNPELLLQAVAAESPLMQEFMTRAIKMTQTDNSLFTGNLDDIDSMQLKDTDEAQAAFNKLKADPEIMLKASQMMLADAKKIETQQSLLNSLVVSHFGSLADIISGNTDVTDANRANILEGLEVLDGSITDGDLNGPIVLNIRMPIGEQQMTRTFNQDADGDTKVISMRLNEEGAQKMATALDLILGKEVVASGVIKSAGLKPIPPAKVDPATAAPAATQNTGDGNDSSVATQSQPVQNEAEAQVSQQPKPEVVEGSQQINEDRKNKLKDYAKKRARDGDTNLDC